MRVIALLLCWPLWVGAATYNVGPGGDSETVAGIDWGSINAGDIIDGGGNTFVERMDIGADGADGNPIVIQNFVLDGNDTLATVLTFYDSAAADYITVKDVTIKNATGHGLNFSPTVTNATMTGIRLERVTSTGHGNNCFKLGDPTGGGGFPGLVAIDLVARDCGNAGISVAGQSGAYLLRPYVHTAGINGGNLDGIAIDDGAEGTKVEYPTVINQRAGQAIDFQESSGSDRNYLIGAWVEQASDLSTVDGIGLTGTSPVTVVDSFVLGGRDAYISKSTAAHRIYHSWAVRPTQYGFRAGNSTLNGVLELKNSGAVDPGGKMVWVRNDAGSTIDTNNNAWFTDLGQPFTYKGTSYNLADWRTQTSGAANSSVIATSEISDSFIGGPNPTTAEGFKLKSTSPLIDAGTCVYATGCVPYDYGARRARVPPDIGAWQRN